GACASQQNSPRDYRSSRNRAQGERGERENRGIPGDHGGHLYPGRLNQHWRAAPSRGRQLTIAPPPTAARACIRRAKGRLIRSSSAERSRLARGGGGRG